jgi:elongation factor P--(R)-beta-lysine ligase
VSPLPRRDGLETWQRVRAWDAALAAVRAALREAGLREVSTAVRVDAVALEPWIEPLRSGDKLLATSPELAMKRLLSRGSGSLFQIAHVFRAAERGAQHSEEFHLIEWYRDQRGSPEGITAGMLDVERIVGAVFEAVGAAIGVQAGIQAEDHPRAPTRWRRVKLLDLMGETLGRQLAGNEPAEALEPLLRRVRSTVGVGLAAGERGWPQDPELARLLAWTELFSLWSDHHFDAWLDALEPGVGVHVEGFPASLAALAEHEPDHCSAARFESHVGGVELANGYRELRDPIEQRRRFELVAAMRAHYGLAPLPIPEAFLAELHALPPCVGVALGLDRLITLACGQARLDHVALTL